MRIEKYSSITNLMNSITVRLGYSGYAVVDQSWKTNQLATPFNRLYLIESGTGELSTDTETVTLAPGKVYLLPAGLPCSYHCDDSLTLLFFHFNIAPPDRFDLMHNTKRLAVLDFTQEQFAMLRKMCQDPSYDNAFAVTCAINDMVLVMHNKYQFHWDKAPVYSKAIAKAIAYINENLSSQLRIEEIAQNSFISGSYLARQFRKEVGMTIKQYVNMQLINTAQWQLSHTSASVEKISSDLGFCNQFYFSEHFKKHCRVSPLQYRHGTKY